jgi:hypothetical protein
MAHAILLMETTPMARLAFLKECETNGQIRHLQQFYTLDAVHFNNVIGMIPPRFAQNTRHFANHDY